MGMHWGTLAESQARKVARFYRAFTREYRAEFGEEFRRGPRDAEYLIHHVLQDCCGRVEWAIAQAGRMLSDPAAKPGTFADLWLAFALRELRVPAADRKREASKLRAAVLRSARWACESAETRRRAS